MEESPEYEICNPEQEGKGGTYGIVRKAINTKTGEFCAIKLLKYGFNKEGITPSAIRQISILKELTDHPNIISLKQTISHEGLLYLVFEYRELNLREFLASFDINSELIKKILIQILNGIQLAHSRQIMHRDIKPENILVSSLNFTGNKNVSINSFKVQIADWGLSRMFFRTKQVYTLEVVSLPYRAPQLILGMKDYNQAIDLWSIGCIFAEMLTGDRVFTSLTEIGQLQSILTTIGVPSKSQWPFLYKSLKVQTLIPLTTHSKTLDSLSQKISHQALSLLKMLLELNPDKRISARKALEHPYFKQGL